MNIKKILAEHAKWLNDPTTGQWANLQGADLQGADLQGANLQRANIQEADLQRANLRGADLDFACWPLWCGSLGVKIDERIAAQLAYHLLSVWPEASKGLKKLANKFHRSECPRIK